LKMGLKKNRLDKELVERGLTVSREKGVALIMAGEVVVDGQIVYKADRQVTADSTIEIKKRYPYASRGGIKIEKAFERFAIDTKGLKAVDIGISTGGFSDYMLQHGAARVTGVDVNIDQVDYRLRQDGRLSLLKKNARFLERGDIDYEPDLITVDLSFISVTKVLPVLKVFKEAKILCLVKPQFESEKYRVGKGGVVRDSERRLNILLTLKNRIEALGYGVLAFTEAGVKGRKGNREYFFLLGYGNKVSIDDKIVADAIKV
jgi:23S rRNA (cytidine1920-2'-O)/16S rRNA (cytidine1409-2'-O)-methyltransferase